MDQDAGHALIARLIVLGEQLPALQLYDRQQRRLGYGGTQAKR
jgi:hypothetical protein